MREALHCAQRLLMRREHSAHELLEKLYQKGHDREQANKALAECQRCNWQSDARFADMVCRTRISQGYGPVRIKRELSQHRLDPELIDEALKQQAPDWHALAECVLQKKVKMSDDVSRTEQLKQQRFLMNRGFPMDVIRSMH